MSRIVISDLNQESILTDLSDEQVDAIQGGILSLAVIAFGVGYGIGTAIRRALF